MGSAYEQFVTSLANVRAPVRARVGGQPYDPTGDTVEMAFIPLDQQEPGSADWNAATWETDTNGGTVSYLAVCLVGPGAVELAVGSWHIFVRITDNPEVPVLECPTTLSII